ncbi:hypothetical protein Ciccas_008069 [Cichlidogyrus casuarinus]|uniref:Uncharacterized protein n=1 Tax=Cichlidogyrus casuarinus TaxID=1844966 RepID=A0ABD2Q2G3_9PLAT
MTMNDEFDLWPIEEEVLKNVSTSFTTSKTPIDIISELKQAANNSNKSFPSEQEVSFVFTSIENEKFVRLACSANKDDGLFQILAVIVMEAQQDSIQIVLNRVMTILHAIPERQDSKLYESLLSSTLVSSVAKSILKVSNIQKFEDFPGLLMDLLLFCPREFFTKDLDCFDFLHQRVVQLLLKMCRLDLDDETLLHTLIAINLLMEIAYINGTFKYFAGDLMFSSGLDIVGGLKRNKDVHVKDLATEFFPRFSELMKTQPGQKRCAASTRHRHQSAPLPVRKQTRDQLASLSFLDF